MPTPSRHVTATTDTHAIPPEHQAALDALPLLGAPTWGWKAVEGGSQVRLLLPHAEPVFGAVLPMSVLDAMEAPAARSVEAALARTVVDVALEPHSRQVALAAHQHDPANPLVVISVDGGCTTQSRAYAAGCLRRIATWMGLAPERIDRGIDALHEDPIAVYAMAQAVQERAIAQAQRTRTTITCDLHPQLRDHVGARVEVETADGVTERFQVGRSTGILPILLRVHSRRSYGGMPISYDEVFTRVQVVRARDAR
jgi:hypothetical protein